MQPEKISNDIVMPQVVPSTPEQVYGVPKVTCLCATKGRYELLRSSISYFLLQDYPNKELLIFNNHATPMKLSPFLEKQGNIRLINGGEFSSIADVYNSALSHVDEHTKFVAIWDDDDIYLPWHLSTGVRYLADGTYVGWKPEEQLQLDHNSEHYPKIPAIRNHCEGSIMVSYEVLNSVGFGAEWNAEENAQPQFVHPRWMAEVNRLGGFIYSTKDENSFVYYWCDENRSKPHFVHLTNGGVEGNTQNNDTGEGRPLHPGSTYFQFIIDNLWQKKYDEEYTAEEKESFSKRLNSYDWHFFEERKLFPFWPWKKPLPEEVLQVTDNEPINPLVSLLFVGHDRFTKFTRLAVAHFIGKGYDPIRMYHASHTIPLAHPKVTDILMPQYLKPPIPDDEFHYLGKDLFIARMLEVLKMIPTKYVWYIMPDHFYSKLPPYKVVDREFIPCMEYWGLHQLKLHPWASVPPDDANCTNEIIHDREGVVIKYSGGSPYTMSHHATIYNKEWLVESLLEVQRKGDFWGKEAWSNQHHELHYWTGCYPERLEQVKKTHGDTAPIHAAFVSNHGDWVELTSGVKLGKLNNEGKAYLETCELPEALPLKGINLEDENV